MHVSPSWLLETQPPLTPGTFRNDWPLQELEADEESGAPVVRRKRRKVVEIFIVIECYCS